MPTTLTKTRRRLSEPSRQARPQVQPNLAVTTDERSTIEALHTAVTALSRLHETFEPVADLAGGKQRLVAVHSDSLLSCLREAILAGIGSHDGTHVPFREKSLINVDALELYDRIEDEISELHHRLTGKPDYAKPEQTLTAWQKTFLTEFRRGRVSDKTLHETVELLESWVASIRTFLDPPHTLEITSPCPECGERYAHHPATGETLPALVVQYRESLGHAMLDCARGVCRFCEAVWVGRDALRQLRAEVEAPRAAAKS